MFLLDPDPSPGFIGFFDAWGLHVGNNLVVDNSGVGRLFGMGPEVPAVSRYGKHSIVQSFSRQNTFFPGVRSVTPKRSGIPEMMENESLAQTSANSWAEVDMPGESSERIGDKAVVTFDEGKDTRGPISIAALVTVRLIEGSPDDVVEIPIGALAVFGDSDFASNIFNGHQPNLTLFLNTISWLAQEQDLVSIPPKDPKDRRITMSEKQVTFVLYLTVFIIPGLILLSGVSIFVRRKSL